MQLATRCYRMTQSFPASEIYGLTSQLCRAAVSVPANIAEGYGRESTGSFVQFLRVAQGSLKELETHILISQNVDLLNLETASEALGECDRVGIMLRKLIRALQAKAAAET